MSQPPASAGPPAGRKRAVPVKVWILLGLLFGAVAFAGNCFRRSGRFFEEPLDGTLERACHHGWRSRGEGHSDRLAWKFFNCRRRGQLALAQNGLQTGDFPA